MPERVKKISLSFTEFSNQVARDKIGNLYFFEGEEDFLKKQARQKLASALLSEDSKTFNLEILEARQGGLERILDSPLFSDKRLIVVQNVEELKLPDKEFFLSILKNLPESTCLVIEASKADMREKFYKFFEEKAVWVKFPKLKEGEIRTWIEKTLKEQNKKISFEACQLLIENSSLDFSDLNNELEKLLLYTQDQALIQVEDISGLVGMARPYEVYDLLPAVAEKRPHRALEILSVLLSSKESPGRILSVLADHFLGLLKVKSLAEQNKLSHAHQSLKSKAWLLEKYLSQIKNFSQATLEKSISLMYQTEKDLHYNLLEDKMALELLVYQLCRL